MPDHIRIQICKFQLLLVMAKWESDYLSIFNKVVFLRIATHVARKTSAIVIEI